MKVVYMWHRQFLIKTDFHLVSDTDRQRQPSGKQQNLQLITYNICKQYHISVISICKLISTI